MAREASYFHRKLISAAAGAHLRCHPLAAFSAISLMGPGTREGVCNVSLAGLAGLACVKLKDKTGANVAHIHLTPQPVEDEAAAAETI